MVYLCGLFIFFPPPRPVVSYKSSGAGWATLGALVHCPGATPRKVYDVLSDEKGFVVGWGLGRFPRLAGYYCQNTSLGMCRGGEIVSAFLRQQFGLVA